jgi:hypothetical protein
MEYVIYFPSILLNVANDIYINLHKLVKNKYVPYGTQLPRKTQHAGINF